MNRKKLTFFILITLFLISPFLNAEDKKSCTSMTRTECIVSKNCVLELIKKKKPSDPVYRCRTALPPCEGLNLEECKTAKNCIYDPGGCYCRCKGYGSTFGGDDDAPPCKCYCGFGSPPLCKDLKK